MSGIVKLNQYIQLGCLPTNQSDTYPGINVAMYAAGWGLTSSEGTSPDFLNNVKITAYDASYCSLVSALENGQICAGMFC